MVKISSARIDMERARVDNALVKDYGEILVGGATGANTGAAFSIDLSAANMFNLILNAPVVDMAFINAGPSGTMCSFTVILRQDSVGGRKISWPGTVLWDGGVTPALTTTPGRLDILSFMTPDGGRKWFGFIGQQNITGLNLSTTKLWAWGWNTTGELGVADTAPRLIPAGVNTTVTTWQQIAAAGQNTAGIDSFGQLWTWGINAGGTLGDNTSILKSSPIQIGTLTNWASLAGMTETFHATKTDGTLWGWGYNTTGSAFGDVGNNTSTTTFSSPVQIGTLTNWSKLAFGSLGYHGGAIKTDSTLWMWGVGTSGQLGNSTIVSVSSPIQIGTLTNWASLAGMTETFHATKTDGTLWSWGLNNAAQLGQNNVATGLSSPVQIGTLTNWANIAAGYRHGAAIKTDGTLWAWGYNTAGQLGDKTVTVRSSPVQIGTLTNWFGFALGRYFTVATKTDGTLWAWGSNTIGQLGTGDQNNRSSPVQIGQANTWTQIAAGQSHTVALKA